MPSALNALFKSGSSSGSRRTSLSSAADANAEQSTTTGHDRSATTPANAPTRLGASAQRSVPPIATSKTALDSYTKASTLPPQDREAASRSDSCPSIEIVSPTGSAPRQLWKPRDRADEEQSPSASSLSQLTAIASSSSQTSSLSGHSSNYDQKTPVAEDFRPDWRRPLSTQEASSKMVGRPAHTDDEDDDPLYSLAKPVARKATRTSVMSPRGRGGKGEAPDRHDIMRRAMAEATTSSTYDGSSTNRSNGNNGDRSGHAPTSSSQGTMIDHERPSEGSLSINHFDTGGADEIVLSDAAAVAAAERNRMAQQDDKARAPVGRPRSGSRAESTIGDAGGQDQGTPSKVKSSGHLKAATVGMTPDGKPAKQTSLIVPSPANAAPAQDAKHRMPESSSTSALLASPLQRLRKTSDAGKKGGPPAGGIAGALAASGLAGMGVGNSDLLRQSQQAVSATQSPRVSPTRTRPTPSPYREFVGASQGGVFRDPATGKMVEHGPSSFAQGAQANMLRSRSATGGSSASHESSDNSVGSGLIAAADFARGLQQHSPHLDSNGMMSPGFLGNGMAPGMSADRARQLTPNGIGAVHGLSPSGLGERVELGLDDEEPWPGADVDAQITGFAVASSKRNADFHALFNSVPEDDYLIEDYGCALVREILIQGRLYVSENHVCFHANIFGWITSIVTPFSDIVAIEKRMTAYVIPNAIQVATLHSKHTFASFLSRDTTYDVVVNIWKLSHPTLPSADSQIEVGSDDESVDGAEHDNETAKGKHESQDGVSTAPSKKSRRNIIKKKLGIKDAANGTHGIAAAVMAPDFAAAIARGKSPTPSGGKKQAHRKTTCPCDRDKKHLPTVALDTTFPTVPEKLYNLIFTSGFTKEFWTDNQKLMELQMSDWAPNPANNNMLSREVSYIKPLAGGFGPKQTKCILNDENEHVDFDEYIITATTTRTPDVPSGGSFSVKTRTCITWDGGNVSRMYVTCAVEWTGRSMVKSIVDRACIEGQKQYYKDLDAAIRSYIKEHASEFREEGEDPEEAAAALQDTAPSTKEEHVKSESSAQEEKQGLAKYLSMASEAGSAVVDMSSGVLDALSDLLGGVRPQVIILGFIVLLLVVSNLFALRGGSGRDPLDPHRLSVPQQHHRASDAMHYASQHGHDAASHVSASASAEAVALAVRDVLKDYFEPQGHGSPLSHAGDAVHPRLQVDRSKADPVAEISKLLNILDDVEARVTALRASLDVAKDSATQRSTSSKNAASAQK